jgi:hypothetical protein
MFASAFCLPISESELQALARHRARGIPALADELAQHVRVQYWRGKFNPNFRANSGLTLAKQFDRWANACMLNYLRDTFRRSIPMIGSDGLLQDAADPCDDRAAFELHTDLATPFRSTDTDIVRRWKPRKRIAIMCWGLVWQKLPVRLWRDTLAALGLPLSFPEVDFADLTQTERRERLKSALRISDSGLSRILTRGLPQLRALQFFSDLASA